MNNRSKLSDKERWLLAYLEGTDTTQLMKLGKESTTRNYGELACIDEKVLTEEICKFFQIPYQDVPKPRESNTVGSTYNTTQTSHRPAPNLNTQSS